MDALAVAGIAVPVVLGAPRGISCTGRSNFEKRTIEPAITLGMVSTPTATHTSIHLVNSGVALAQVVEIRAGDGQLASADTAPVEIVASPPPFVPEEHRVPCERAR